MISWHTSFKMPTKKADEFIYEAHHITDPFRMESRFYETRKPRITEVNIHPPSFGYRVSLNDDLGKIAEVKERFEAEVENMEAALLDLAVKFDATVQVWGEKSRFVEAARLKKALTLGPELAKTLKATLDPIKEKLKDENVEDLITTNLLVYEAEREKFI